MGSKTGFLNITKSVKGIWILFLLLLSPMVAQAGTWTMIGPDGGYINDICSSPNFDLDKTVFLATKHDGVMKSTDGGKNWSHINTGLDSLWINAVALSPNFGSDNTLYAGTLAGVFKSTNGGRSWTHLSNGLTTFGVETIKVSPSFSSDSTLVVGTNGGGVFISSDKGANWAPVNIGLTNLYVNAIAISPSYSSDSTIYAGTAQGGIFKTVNRGSTWSVINGVITSLQINAIALSPSFGADHTAFVATGVGGVYKTTNGGTTWVSIKTGMWSLAVSALAVSPSYSSDGTVFAGTVDGGIFTSTNGGTSWNAGDSTLVHHRIRSIHPSSHYATDQRLFVGSDDGHGLFSQSGNNPWERDEDGMKNINITAEAVSPNFGVDNTLYVATEERGIFKTTNGGSTWVDVNSGLTSLSPTALVISPNYAADNTLFAGFKNKNAVYITVNGGASWTALSSGLDHTSVQALGISPNFGTDHTLMAGMKGGWGIYKSVDGGSTWVAINSGLTKPNVNAIIFSPNYLSDQTVYAGTAQGGVYKSVNGGSSWSAINTGLTDLSVSAFAISPGFASDSTIYVATASSGIFKSVNKGSNWAPVNTGLTNLSVTSMVISPAFVTKPTLFVSTAGSGVYQSWNGGTLWGQVNNHLDNLHVNTLGISPGYPCDGTLFAGTEGSSGWRYADTEAINICNPPPPPPPTTPLINSISPTSGPTGSSVIIAGTNFGSSQGSSQALFNGAPGTVSSWSDTQVIATVPSGATTGPVTILVNGISSNGVTFTVTTPPPPSNPVISTLSPLSGEVGIAVTVSGSNFGSSMGSSTILFNGVVASVSSWSSTQIVATVPSTATTGPVVVIVNSVSSNGVNFTVLPPSPPPSFDPVISGISPTSGAIGVQVTISGSYFGSAQGASQVLFNGAPGTINSWSDTQVIVTVPSGATTGPLVVVVNGVTSNGVTFTVTTPPPPSNPVISSLSPNTGFVGTQVTINGSNFGPSQGSSLVLFNGVAADTISSWTASQIIATVPIGATTGPAVVVVGGVSSNGVVFTVSTNTGQGAAVVCMLNPMSAYYTMPVTITGYGFGDTQGSSTVSFNGVIADTITKWTDTQIIVQVPAVASSGAPVVTVNGLPNTYCNDFPWWQFVVYTGSDAPDLTVQGITGIASMSSIFVSDTEVNTGVSAAVPFQVAFYLSELPVANPATDTLLGVRMVNGISGGNMTNTGVNQFTVPPTMPIGNYYLCAIADSTNQVAETFENNNNKCTTTTLAVTPDLKVTTLSAVISTTTVVVTDTEQNIGNQPAGPFNVDYYFSSGTTPNPATDYFVGSRSLDGLAGAVALSTGSIVLTVPPSIPAANYYFCAITDSTDQVAELFESNNTKCTTATLSVSPDLKVNAVSATLSGTNLVVSDTEINSGDQPAGAFTVAFYLSATTTPNPATDTLIGTRDILGLAGGGSTNTLSSTLPIPPAMPIGNYYFCAISDSTNQVPEVLENNNFKCTTTLLAIAPDLKGSSVSGSLSGLNITVTDTQMNSGNQPAGSFNVGFYLAKTTTPNPSTDVLIGSRNIASLAAASATNGATTSFGIPPAMAIGNYYVCSIADYTNLVPELAETNNFKCSTSTYAVSPDLKPSTISGSLSGLNVVISDTETNSGNQAAGAYKVGFYLAKTTTLNALTDILIGSRNIASLAGAGATNLASVTIPIPPTMPAGKYYACALSDSDNQVGELLETNNSKCGTTLLSISPDLTVSALTASLSGTTITVNDTTKNTGNQPAGPFNVGFYLAKTTVPSTTTDALFGTRPISTLAGSGATNLATTVLAVPPTLTAGNYYVCAIADYNNLVTELVETNNYKCSTATIAITPDLKVSTIGASKSGTTITVSDTQINSGSQPAGPFTVSFYLSLDKVYGTGDILLGSRSIASLDGGSTKDTATTPFTVPTGITAGSYYVIGVSDSGNTVVELTETNNTLSTSLAIVLP